MMSRSKQWGGIGRILVGTLVFSPAASIRGQDTEDPKESLDAVAEGIKNIELLQRGLDQNNADSVNPSVDLNTPFLEADGGASTALRGRGGRDGASSDREAGDAWRRENWLLAGMQQKAEEDLFGEDEDMGETTPRTGTSEHWLLLADEATRAESARQTDDAKLEVNEIPDGVVNPLAGFMAGWLDPSLASSAAFESPTETFEALQTEPWESPGLEPLPGTPAAGDLFRVSGPQLDGSSDARHNPYAVGLNGVAAGLSDPALESEEMQRRSPTLTAPMSPPTTAPVAAPESTPKPRREAWRPPDKADEKYFRRLNRF